MKTVKLKKWSRFALLHHKQSGSRHLLGRTRKSDWHYLYYGYDHLTVLSKNDWIPYHMVRNTTQQSFEDHIKIGWEFIELSEAEFFAELL